MGAAWGPSLPSVRGEEAKESHVPFQPMGDMTSFPNATFLLDPLEVWCFGFFFL